jgi:hypothetical protein
MPTNQAKGNAVLLTADESKFVRSLKKGDVLLFDSLHLTSQLIKLALNRPVNHSAIYVGDERYADANDRPAGQPTVGTSDIWNLLGRRSIRTVTALRHKQVVAGHMDATSVVDEATAFIGQKDIKFAYLSLAILAVPQLERTYVQGGGDPGPLKRVMGGMLGALSDSLMSTIKTLGDARSLTCSEFVYRCYAGANATLGVEIVDSPALWASGQRREQAPKPPDPLGGAMGSNVISADDEVGAADMGVVDEIDLVAFQDDVADIASGLMQWDVVGSPDLGQALGVSSGLVTVARTAFMVLMGHNLRLHKYGDPKKPDINTGEPIPDAVSPRDLWGSPSLVACSVLHRPPRQPADSSGLDA